MAGDELAGGRALLLTALEGFSFVQPWREHSSDCTYCRRRGNHGRVSLTSFASRLTVLDYETLLDRGWMRSGSSVYLPSNVRSCCPNLPIRLDALRFEPSRAQRIAVRRVREALAGVRAIVLPERVVDPLLRCLELAKEGRAGEAVEAVLANRLHRGADGRADPVVVARARALGIHFLSEERDFPAPEGDQGGLHQGPRQSEGVGCEDETMGDNEEVVEEEDEEKQRGGGGEGAQRAAAAGPFQKPFPPPLPPSPPPPQISAAAAATLAAPFGVLEGGASATSLATAPATALAIVATAIAVRRSLAGGAPFDVPPLASVRIEAFSDKARRAKSSNTIRVPDAVCNAAFALAAHARAAAGAGAGADGIAASVASELASRLAVLPSIGEGVLITVIVGGAGFLNIFVDAQEGALARALAATPEFQAAKAALPPAPLATRTTLVCADPDPAALAARVPDELNSATVRTRAERTALAAFHTAQQAQREIAGRADVRSDPFFLDTGRDDSDGAPSDGEGETDGIAKRFARQAEAYALDVSRSVSALISMAADGVGSVAGALRAAAESARAARGGGGPLLALGAGPLKLRCSLKRPAYSLEAHELYGRFNMSLHRGKPSSEERENFVRHLVDSVLIPAPAWSVGAALSVAHPETRDAHEVAAAAARNFFHQHTDVPSQEAQAVTLAQLVAQAAVEASAQAQVTPTPTPPIPSPPPPAAIIVGIPAFALGALLDLPPPCEPAVAASWGDVLRSLSVALDEPLLAPEPEGTRGGVFDELEDLIRTDPLAAWQLADVARTLSTISLCKARIIAGEAAKDGRGARAILSSAAGAPIRVVPARAPPAQRFAPLPAAFGPFLTAARCAGGLLPGSMALALYAVAVDIVNGAKLGLAAVATANKRRAAWKARRDGADDLAVLLFVPAVDFNHDAMDVTISAIEQDASRGEVANVAARDVRLARELLKKEEMDRASAKALAAVVRALGREDARMVARAEMGDFSDDEDMDEDSDEFGSQANGGNSGGSGDGDGDPPTLLCEVLRAISLVLPEPPPTPVAVISVGLLSPEALSNRINTWLSRHDATLAWLECATAAMLREVSEMTFRSIPVAETVAEAVEGGGGETGECGSLPGDSWFDSWIERAPTLCSGRHGTMPLRDATAYAAEDAAAHARAAARGAILVEGWDLPLGFGTFFMEWRVGTALVAVSVLDILPSRVASVYFFYDPDFRGALQLGKMSVLVEAWVAREIARFSYTHSFLTSAVPTGWGVLGGWLDLNFYVHACAQMKYKREFSPSEVLCPTSRVWVPLDAAALARLDAAPDGPLSPNDPSFDDAEVASLIRNSARVAESQAAEQGLPAMLCQLNDGRWYTFSDLSVASRESCKMSLAAWLRGVGPDLGSRTLIDPNSAALVGYRVADRRQKKAAEAQAKVEAATAADALLQHEAVDAAELRVIALAIALSQEQAGASDSKDDDEMEQAIAASLTS